MPGETCAMTLMCCGADRRSVLVAIAEEDTEVRLVPVQCAEEWMRWPEWRHYVSDTQAQRFMELLETIEVVAFKKLDEQLWNYLVKRTQALGLNELKVTHQEIATELNSPREVVTRLLHQLERQGRIRLARGTITVHG
jgi:CRP/FNR family transcriptional regulator